MGDPAIGYYFMVSLDEKKFAVFTKVEGLGASYDTMTIKEGGENTFVHTIPGRVSYENVKLTRPVDSSSGNLAAWFTEYQRQVQEGKRYKPQNMAVSACNADDEVVATWSLLGVVPVRYSGPTFQAGSTTVLTETIELAHNGFWSGAPGSPSAMTSGSGSRPASTPAAAAGRSPASAAALPSSMSDAAGSLAAAGASRVDSRLAGAGERAGRAAADAVADRMQ